MKNTPCPDIEYTAFGFFITKFQNKTLAFLYVGLYGGQQQSQD